MGTKRNKKAIIITGVLMLLGLLLTLTGFFGDRILGLFQKDLDYKNLSAEDIGSDIRSDFFVYYEPISIKDKTLQVVGDMEGEYGFILLDLSKLSAKDKELYFKKASQHITISGKIRGVDDAEFQTVLESLYKLYDHYFYDRPRYKENGDLLTLEEFREYVAEPVIPYCINVTSIESFNWIPFIPAGILIFLVSLVLEICFVFKLKKRIVVPIAFAVIILIPVIMFFNHIRTILSVNKVSDGLYTMKNLECTDTEGLLASGSGSVDELLGWIMGRHFYGAPNVFAGKLDFGCACFAAKTSDGDHLFGRNFDFPETDTLLVYSHPQGAYESIGNADLGIMGVGKDHDIDPDTPLGRLVMMITPYAVVDGMNEKGVGAGILQLSVEETHQDEGNHDLLIFCAVRAILDKCASVDEALELLDSYDIQSDMATDYHLFVTDRSGRYVVVEWLEGKMEVTEHPVCTNTVITPGEYYGKGDADFRLPTLESYIGSGKTYSMKEAMDILEKVSSHKDLFQTEWSCVYNLDDFTVDICLDRDYKTVYTFSAEDLR